VIRLSGQPMPDEVLFPWPMPQVIGLEFDPQAKAKVKNVIKGSSAEKDGFKAGDEILALEGQPMLSIADVQWVMHTAKAPAKLKADVQRGRTRTTLSLSLNDGWRRPSDISWRPSSWDLRRMAMGGLRVFDVSGEPSKRGSLKPADMAFEVRNVPEYGEQVAKKAGFLKNDIIVGIDGLTKQMTESDLIAYLLKKKSSGNKVPTTVLRGDQRINLELPSQ
jgi:S1-C subfamily serine protease